MDAEADDIHISQVVDLHATESVAGHEEDKKDSTLIYSLLIFLSF